MIKLYDATFSGTRGTRVRWLLEELEVPYEVVAVDPRKGEHKQPAYMAVHPHGVIPALEIGGLRLIESGAICLHLADAFAERGLAPPVGTAERARYYQWIAYAVATLDEPTLGHFFHTHLLPPEQRRPEPVERGRALWSLAGPHLAQALAGREWLVGDRFSAADVVVGYVARIAELGGLLEAHPAVGAYVARLSARPACKRAYQL